MNVRTIKRVERGQEFFMNYIALPKKGELVSEDYLDSPAACVVLALVPPGNVKSFPRRAHSKVSCCTAQAAALR